MTGLNIDTNFNKPNVCPKFKANQGVSKPVETEEKKGLSTGAKWAVGAGLIALAATGVYLATRGKFKPKEIKGMPIDTFKRGKNANTEGVNRLVNGQAILADGTKYTGNITTECKSDGSKVVMEYIDGILQKSTKTAKDGENIFEKVYFYAKDGNLEEVKDSHLGTIWKKVINNEKIQVNSRHNYRNHYYIIDKNSGRLIEHSCDYRKEKIIDRVITIHDKKYIYSDEGILKYQILNHHDYDGKFLLEFHPDGKTPKIIVQDNKTAIYDEKGELLYKLVDEGWDTTYSGKKLKNLTLDEGKHLYVRFRSNNGPFLSPDDCVKYNLPGGDIIRTVSLKEKNPSKHASFTQLGYKKDGKVRFAWNNDDYGFFPIGDKDNKYRISLEKVNTIGKTFAEFDSMTGAIKILDDKYTIDDAKKAIESANTCRKKIKSLYRKALEIQKESQNLRTIIQDLG